MNIKCHLLVQQPRPEKKGWVVHNFCILYDYSSGVNLGLVFRGDGNLMPAATSFNFLTQLKCIWLPKPFFLLFFFCLQGSKT